MDQFTRRIVGFGVHSGTVDGVSLCCLFNKIIASNGIPQRLCSDNDPLFRYHQWQANLRILDVEEIKSVPYKPTSHPFIERLIGTFGMSTLITSFSGTQPTSSENLMLSNNTTTSNGFINRSAD